MNLELVSVNTTLKNNSTRITVQIYYKDNTIVTQATRYYFDMEREAIDLFNDYNHRFHTIDMTDPHFRMVTITEEDRYGNKRSHMYLKKPDIWS